MKNTGNKSPKINNQHKQLLAKKINELGIDGVLYPNAIEGRHPYTQEIMLLAMSQNVKQGELSVLCGVTQSQISQWANGKGLATVDKLARLLPQLKNTAPGSSFHKLDVVKKRTIKLPKEWEQESFIAYLQKVITDEASKINLKNICKPVFEKLKTKSPHDWYSADYSYYWKSINFNLEFLEAAVYGTLKQEHSSQIETITKQHQEQLDSITSKIGELQSSKQSAEEEEQDNQSKMDTHAASMQEFYNERPELSGVSDDVKKSLALREYPEPEAIHDSNHTYEMLLQSIAEDMNASIDYSTVIELLNHKVEELKAEHDTEISTLKNSQDKEKNERTILGKYNPDCAVPSIQTSDFFLLPLNVIQSKADELYDSITFDLVVPLKAVIKNTYLRTEHEIVIDTTIKLNAKEAFIDFCSALPLLYEKELVQVSGHCIFTFGDIKCYRLHSDRLLIKHKSQSEHDYIHVDYDGNSAIDTIRKLNDIYNIGSELEENLTNTLIDQGYLLTTVRTIY
ncbi:helix-turn-helix domain-containing protein [Vibrio sp. J383]|uniref:helix-turn-helix domain-containing protein n=1 Tax=Vibrio sp. J383 TaxID=2942997 RepID=UPI0020BDB257|nr:helix-turn-helix transcriptional regulator [Vibrio sp. J383]UQV20500.1 helix-turn-helix transcriptional regulator [Vibrio sp. J383]